MYCPPEPRVAAEGAQPAADDRRRIEPGRVPASAPPSTSSSSCRARRRWRCRTAAASARRASRRAAITGTCRARAAATSGLSARDGRRDDDDVGVADVRGLVSDRRRVTPSDASRSVMLRSPRVGSADLVAEIGEQLGDAAHADAADPDEVHAPRAPEQHHISARPASPATRDPRAIRGPRCRAASGRAKRAHRRAPSPCSRAGVAEQRRRRPPASVSPASSRSSSITAAPASASTRAFLRWWSSVAAGNGTSTAGRPARGQLGQRRRAGAADHQVGRRHFAGDRVQKGLRPRGDAGPRVAVADDGQVALAGLVDDFEHRRVATSSRRRRHHGHVDCVRALGAAKD